MSYLKRQAERRKDPGQVLENARSIIVAGMNYYSGNAPAQDPGHGRICRYAWFDDYHDVLKASSERL